MRRKIAALLLLCSFVYADKLAWSHEYKAGLAQAKDSGKIMMLMLSQKGCAMCEYMHDTVFEDGEVAAYIQAHFVPVELDIHGDTLPPRMRAYGTPTFYFIDGNGKKISQVIGGAKPPVFLQKLREIRTGSR